MTNGETSRPILASASRTRRAMLARAGVVVDVHPADLDEASMIASLTAPPEPVAPDDIAQVLARAKAQSVAEASPGRIVIGCDQVLSLGDEVFSKPDSMDTARRNLLRLSARTHQLHSAAAIVRDGETLWSDVQTARLTMRPLSPAFIGHYLASAGPSVLTSVGAYQIEGLGAQLFEHRTLAPGMAHIGAGHIPRLEGKALAV